MIRVENLSKKLNGFALQDVSFHLPKGYIMGLVGENGAGKTTLIHCILDLYSWDTGEIFIDGMQYENREKKIKNEIGYVLCEQLFQGNMKLWQVAELYGKYYENYDPAVFQVYCKRFGLKREQKCNQLSKGEGLKLQLAFALSHAPKLLILDEPAANFDPEFQEEFFQILCDFVSGGENSVLLSTHNTSDLDRYGDYLTFLHKGKVLLSMDRQQLEESYLLVSGADYKINLIPGEEIIYKEKGSYGTRALVKYRKRYKNHPDYVSEVPTIEDMMYFMLKGEKKL